MLSIKSFVKLFFIFIVPFASLKGNEKELTKSIVLRAYNAERFSLFLRSVCDLIDFGKVEELRELDVPGNCLELVAMWYRFKMNMTTYLEARPKDLILIARFIESDNFLYQFNFLVQYLSITNKFKVMGQSRLIAYGEMGKAIFDQLPSVAKEFAQLFHKKREVIGFYEFAFLKTLERLVKRESNHSVILKAMMLDYENSSLLDFINAMYLVGLVAPTHPTSRSKI